MKTKRILVWLMSIESIKYVTVLVYGLMFGALLVSCTTQRECRRQLVIAETYIRALEAEIDILDSTAMGDVIAEGDAYNDYYENK